MQQCYADNFAVNFLIYLLSICLSLYIYKYTLITNWRNLQTYQNSQVYIYVTITSFSFAFRSIYTATEFKVKRNLALWIPFDPFPSLSTRVAMESCFCSEAASPFSSVLVFLTLLDVLYVNTQLLISLSYRPMALPVLDPFHCSTEAKPMQPDSVKQN